MKVKQAPLSKFATINPEGITHGYPYQTIEYIDISSVGSGRLVEQPEEILLKDAPSRAKRIVRNKDIILATVRPNLRSFLFINDSKSNTIVSTGFAVLRAKETVNPHFIYCCITDNKFTGYLANNAKGTSYPAVDSDTILRGEIPDFDLTKQQYISDILSTYDDFIDTNRRRIQLLEESARLLFREWFVYFRFPLRLRSGQAGHGKVKIVDGIPEGWRKRRLVEVADIVMGQSPKSEYYNDDGMGLPFHQGVTGFGDRYPTNQTYCTQKNRIAQAGDILFSVRAPVGRINISTEKIIIGRGLSAIRSKDNHQSYLFHELKNHFFKEDMIGVGAIFAAITKNDLENVVVIYPNGKTIEQFESITNPIDMQIEILSKQNQKLAQARDLLLPRLMSGAIDPVRYDKLSNGG